MIADRTLSEIGSKPLGKVRRPKLTYHRNPSLKQERHPFHSRKSMLKRRALRHQWQPIFVIAAVCEEPTERLRSHTSKSSAGRSVLDILLDIANARPGDWPVSCRTCCI